MEKTTFSIRKCPISQKGDTDSVLGSSPSDFPFIYQYMYF